jgi:hypothetical protein
MGKTKRSRENAVKNATKSKRKEDVMPQHALQFLKWLPTKYPDIPGLSADIERFLNGSEGAKSALRERVNGKQ